MRARRATADFYTEKHYQSMAEMNAQLKITSDNADTLF